MPLQSWAIYRHESKGRLEYLGVITAKDGTEAHQAAVKLLPKENPENLIVEPWTGRQQA